MLLSELSGRGEVGGIEEELRPMYRALPKNEVGRLEPSTVRYALHRYFVAKHGWQVKGLDTAAGAGNSSETTVLKARAPAYILSLFEEHMHGTGLGLHELAVFAATLEELIHHEATGQLEWIYRALGLSLTEPVPEDKADDAMEFFLMAVVDFGSVVADTHSELEELKVRITETYPDFPDTRMWLDDLRHTHEREQFNRRNPFVERKSSFDESLKLAYELGHRFGAFQDLECRALKSKLVDMEHFGTGRVLLSKFYSHALAGDWQLMESMEYLRNQGALDETDPDCVSVVIPNYVNSPANCLTGSDFYLTCCINECEQLLGHLEGSLSMPRGVPSQIAELVSSLHSDTVDAPRNLSTALLTRLDEIAQNHDGRIPLHGRLFAQWMHHASPRECPFPHVTGTTSPLSQEEFMEMHGPELLAVSEDVMRLHAARANLTLAAPEALPWTSDEELIAEDKQGASGKRRLPPLLPLAALAALVSFAVPLVRSFKTSAGAQSKQEQHFV